MDCSVLGAVPYPHPTCSSSSGPQSLFLSLVTVQNTSELQCNSTDLVLWSLNSTRRSSENRAAEWLNSNSVEIRNLALSPFWLAAPKAILTAVTWMTPYFSSLRSLPRRPPPGQHCVQIRRPLGDRPDDALESTRHEDASSFQASQAHCKHGFGEPKPSWSESGCSWEVLLWARHSCNSQPGLGKRLEGHLGLKKSASGTSLAVQWLRIRLQCRGCEFDPWSGN